MIYRLYGVGEANEKTLLFKTASARSAKLEHYIRATNWSSIEVFEDNKLIDYASLRDLAAEDHNL